LNLRKFGGAPGPYRLEGRYDWDAFLVPGTVRLHKLGELKGAQVTPESRDRFISNTGPVSIDLAGVDFAFIEHAELHRPSSAHEIDADLPADRSGPPDRLSIETDTDGLRPGPYLLKISRIDGASTEVPLRLLPANPMLLNTPLRVNQGDREETVTLTGDGLDRIESLESAGAQIGLASADGGTKRQITVRLGAGAKAGDKLALSARIEGRSAPLMFAAALQVAPPRPQVKDAKASLPDDLKVAVKDGELPAGSWANFAITVDPADAQPILTLACAEPARLVASDKLHVGEKHPSARLASAGPGTLFLSFDPGAIGQSGCTVTASIEVDQLGVSDPFTLGKVQRLPRIESFTMTDDHAANGFYGILKGFDLDTIQKTGWDSNAGTDVAELPRPVAGEGAMETLRIAMPWPSPSPKAPMFVWLRGESAGRATKVTQ